MIELTTTTNGKCFSLDHLVWFWFVNFSDIEKERVLAMVSVGGLLVLIVRTVATIVPLLLAGLV